MTQDKEVFLERWSRRKLEQAEDKAAPPARAEQKDEPVVALPPVEDLNPESDFTPFMNPKVDGQTRRAALKKLFTDAHYNIPDPFEAYSEDYTVSETIPLEMLKTLNHAQKLLFDEPEKKIEAAAAAAAAPQDDADPKDAVGKQDA
jgi:hypothetical protein